MISYLRSLNQVVVLNNLQAIQNNKKIILHFFHQIRVGTHLRLILDSEGKPEGSSLLKHSSFHT